MPSLPVSTASSRKDLKPKRHHGFSVLLFIMGTLFPPLAVAARFGIGRDFWINLLLTICGYFPGHFHNFYIQNIRNNKNKNRTPKWAIRYGLVDTSTMKRKQKRSEWATKYNDRNPESTLESQPLEDGEVIGAAPSAPSRTNTADGQPQSDLWREDDESYYNRDSQSVRTTGSGGSRWRYPANFDDTLPVDTSGTKKKKKKERKDKKDRWARTEDAYSLPDESGTRKRKKKKNRSTVGDDADADTYSRRTDSTTEFPEDPEGAPFRDRGAEVVGNGHTTENTVDIFSHQL